MASEYTARGVAKTAKSAEMASRSRSEGAAKAASQDLIQSRENKWLKAFRAALRGSGPEAGEPIGVEGPKLVEEALGAGLEAEALLISETAERELEQILHAASKSETGISRSRILKTTDKLFASVAGTETPQGVAALFWQPTWSFDDVLHGAALPDGSRRADAPLVVVLAGVQDPGNIGTILRSAEAFGATGAIAARGTAHPWSPKAVRASAGSALRLPVLRGIAAPVLIAQLRMAQVAVFAATLHKSEEVGARGRRLADVDRESPQVATDFRGPCAIFIGSEGHGLPAEVESAADARISIPMHDAVESLNAGVAASVLLYEAARQRRTRRQG
jgi:RNA methyltransferase, TrmH family